MHVDMILADHAFEDADIFGVADLNQQVTASHLDVTGQHVIAVFRRPDQVRGQSRDRMAAISVLSHVALLSSRRSV